MIFFYLLFIIMFLSGIRFIKRDFNDKYLDKDTTTIINGFFVITIFFSHFTSYITDINQYDRYLIMIMSYIGQLMVTSFLFYSGYGIYESIKNKKNYMKSFFKKRFIPTFINFSIAIGLYIIVNLVLGNNYSVSKILLSFTGYESIGNSNWYMLAIFSFYIFIMICFNEKIKMKNIYRILSLTILIGIYIYLIGHFKDNYYVDTILCFPLGMLYSYYSEKINSLLKKNYYLFYIILLIVFGLSFYISRHYMNIWFYNMLAVVFSILMVITTMKFHFKNIIMAFLGNHVFWIYILQRIPMIILKDQFNKYLYLVIALMITIILSYVIKKIVDNVWNNIYKKVG